MHLSASFVSSRTPRTILAGLCGLFLTHCSSGFGGIISDAAPFSPPGFVVGDEPEAAEAGASVLAAGGSAADAATAMYFALAVTYPVAAGLGGGGLCLVNSGTGVTESFAFLPHNPRGNGPYAVPGNVRGFAALQAVYGRLPWQRDITPAEQLATTGFTVSPALAARLATTQDIVRLDASLAAEFLDETGHPKAAGTRVANPDLARTLTLIRTMGTDGFYRGTTADKIVAYGASQNASIAADELTGDIALRAPAESLAVNGATVYLPRSQLPPGAFVRALLDNIQKASAANTAEGLGASVALATTRTLDQFGIKNVPQDLGSTGFVALDNFGQSVACAVTMNGPFGSGRTVEGTGVTLARAHGSEPNVSGVPFLTPAIVTRGNTFVLAAAGAGGPNGAAAVASSLLLAAAGNGDPATRTIRTTGTAPDDTINAILCGGGTCYAVPDRSGYGLARATGG